MFGHLKAEEFTNLIENAELPANRRAHLHTCERCKGTFEAVRNVQAQMSEPDSMEAIPEPDWAEFRSDLRDAMLSRSVQRESAIRRWTGWSLRPVMAWSFSVVFLAGLTAGMFVWNKRPVEPAPVAIAETTEPAGDIALTDVDAASWSQGDVFAQLTQLQDHEVDHLRRLMEAQNSEVTPRQ
jgi:predicted anti-sigma-YlaC factor YlaD